MLRPFKRRSFKRSGRRVESSSQRSGRLRFETLEDRRVLASLDCRPYPAGPKANICNRWNEILDDQGLIAGFLDLALVPHNLSFEQIAVTAPGQAAAFIENFGLSTAVQFNVGLSVEAELGVGFEVGVFGTGVDLASLSTGYNISVDMLAGPGAMAWTLSRGFEAVLASRSLAGDVPGGMRGNAPGSAESE